MVAKVKVPIIPTLAACCLQKMQNPLPTPLQQLITSLDCVLQTLTLQPSITSSDCVLHFNSSR